MINTIELKLILLYLNNLLMRMMRTKRSMRVDMTHSMILLGERGGYMTQYAEVDDWLHDSTPMSTIDFGKL